MFIFVMASCFCLGARNGCHNFGPRWLNFKLCITTTSLLFEWICGSWVNSRVWISLTKFVFFSYAFLGWGCWETGCSLQWVSFWCSQALSVHWLWHLSCLGAMCYVSLSNWSLLSSASFNIVTKLCMLRISTCSYLVQKLSMIWFMMISYQKKKLKSGIDKQKCSKNICRKWELEIILNHV